MQSQCVCRPCLGTVAAAAARSHRAHVARPFSVLNRPPPNYPGHVPLTRIERVALAIGSAIGSLANPRRGDLIAALGEATATPYFIYRLRDVMLRDPTGRRILRDRPRITSQTLKVEELRKLPENSVGRAYVGWLDREGVDPDTRESVAYIEDEECAYVMQRYRESHDFLHAVTGLPVIVEGEVAVKGFEFANTVLPMTGLSLAAYIRLKRKEKGRFWATYFPWALRSGLRSEEVINVYWEEKLDKNVGELRTELGIEKPPDLRETRRLLKEQRHSIHAA